MPNRGRVFNEGNMISKDSITIRGVKSHLCSCKAWSHSMFCGLKPNAMLGFRSDFCYWIALWPGLTKSYVCHSTINRSLSLFLPYRDNWLLKRSNPIALKHTLVHKPAWQRLVLARWKVGSRPWCCSVSSPSFSPCLIHSQQSNPQLKARTPQFFLGVGISFELHKFIQVRKC